ncbi:MAG: hypothetical protein ACXVFL_02370 [Solirubrobacteraceae bacterium]
MSALPLLVKAALAAGVLASMARAFLGPPAPRRTGISPGAC